MAVVIGTEPTRVDLVFYQGRRFRATFSFDSGLDLSGSTFAAQIRASAKSAIAAAMTLETADDDATLAVNELRATVSAEDTAEMSPRIYVWDMDWTDSAGEHSVPFHGEVRVIAQVTR